MRPADPGRRDGGMIRSAGRRASGCESSGRSAPIRVGEIETDRASIYDGDLDDPIESYFPGCPTWAGTGEGGGSSARRRRRLMAPQGPLHADPDRRPHHPGRHGGRPGRSTCLRVVPPTRSPDGGARRGGVAAIDVDTVVITHVHRRSHRDGPGGETVFPAARYIVQRADLEAQWAWAEEDAEDAAIADALLLPLEEAGSLQVVEGDAELAPGVRVRLAPGHTPGHQVVELDSEALAR